MGRVLPLLLQSPLASPDITTAGPCRNVLLVIDNGGWCTTRLWVMYELFCCIFYSRAGSDKLQVGRCTSFVCPSDPSALRVSCGHVIALSSA